MILSCFSVCQEEGQGERSGDQGYGRGEDSLYLFLQLTTARKELDPLNEKVLHSPFSSLLSVPPCFYGRPSKYKKIYGKFYRHRVPVFILDTKIFHVKRPFIINWCPTLRPKQ